MQLFMVVRGEWFFPKWGIKNTEIAFAVLVGHLKPASSRQNSRGVYPYLRSGRLDAGRGGGIEFR